MTMDPIRNLGCKYLAIRDIINLMYVDKEFILEDSDWKYLLYRDYCYDRDKSISKEIYIRNYTYCESKIYEMNITSMGIKTTEYDVWELSKESIKMLTENIPESTRIGDIIHISEYGEYRNDGKLIYNGIQLEILYDAVDEYGSVPYTYTVGDYYKSKHWNKTINHNSVVWIDQEKYKDQMIKNRYCDDKSGTFFNADLGTFHIIFNPHADSNNTSEQTADMFFSGLKNGIRMYLCSWGPDTIYGENKDPYVMYYMGN